jgi:hypothetical protein
MTFNQLFDNLSQPSSREIEREEELASIKEMETTSNLLVVEVLQNGVAIVTP